MEPFHSFSGLLLRPKGHGSSQRYPLLRPTMNGTMRTGSATGFLAASKFRQSTIAATSATRLHQACIDSLIPAAAASLVRTDVRTELRAARYPT
jgi:hypothetical protein